MNALPNRSTRVVILVIVKDVRQKFVTLGLRAVRTSLAEVAVERFSTQLPNQAGFAAVFVPYTYHSSLKTAWGLQKAVD